MKFAAPRGLVHDDDLSEFDSGEPELDYWLRNQAWASHVGGSARSFVSSLGGRVVGYYAMASGGVDRSQAGPLGRGMPASIPIQLLARLAVDVRHQGKGLGAGLLTDAILRAVAIGELTAVRALVVHAKHEAARDFYLKFGFAPFTADHPLHLCMGMKQARQFAATVTPEAPR